MSMKNIVDVVIDVRELNGQVTYGDFVIPEMTHPLSEHWDQPDRRNLIFVGDKIHLTRPVWDALCSYDCTDPSGVYEGKMWRARGVDHKGAWQQLRWYGHSKNPNNCSCNARDVVVCEGMRRSDGRVCRLSEPPVDTPPWALCDAWCEQAMITDADVTCLSCIASGGKAQGSGLHCSLCDSPVGACSHTRRTP